MDHNCILMIERFESLSICFVKLALEFHPVQSEGMQEALQTIHQHQHSDRHSHEHDKSKCDEKEVHI